MSDLFNYSIEDFRGGRANHRKKGPRGAFAYGKGLNIHEQGGMLSCNQKLSKDSAEVVEDLILTMFRGSDDAIYAFGDTGKIYRKPSGGSWGVAYTDTDGKITGASEYENNDGGGNYVRYIYWATQTKLKRIALSGAGGTWSPTEVGTFKVGNANHYHTMKVAAGWLMIADGDRVAIVDREDAFNNEALRISTGNEIKALLDKNDRLIMGTQDDVLDGWIFTWDRLLNTWSDKTPVQAKLVNAIGFLEGGVALQVGNKGLFKIWNFADSHPLKRIPDVEWAYPGGIDEYNGMLHVAMNGGDQVGVYSIGRIDKNEPLATNLEYVTSTGKTENIEIGAIAKDGNDLYVAWKDGSTYGIDIVDQSNKADGVFESLEFDNKMPETTKVFNAIKIVAKTLPANCEIIVKYKTNRDDDWVATKMSDGKEKMEAGNQIGIFNTEANGESYQVQVELKSSGNNCPEIYSINNYFSIGDLY